MRRARERAAEANRAAGPSSRAESAWRASQAGELERGRIHEQAIRERRHLDLDEDRRHAFHWSHFRPGVIVDVLPFGYFPIYVGGATYYYYAGVFYEPTLSGYVVVTPPLGVVVPVLPPGAEAVVAGGVVYYYAAGVFYVQHPNGYRVVPAPLGVTVSSLSPDAVPVNVNGRLYYQARGVHFLPVMQDGVTVFITAQP